jgi:uncharacterized membrane protein
MAKNKQQTKALAKHKDGHEAEISTEVATEDILPCDPSELQKFDQIYPGASADILKEYLARSKSSREINQTVVTTMQKETIGRVDIAKKGQIFGVVIALTLLGLSGWLIKLGNDAGVVLALLTSLPIIISTLMGNKKDHSTKN